MSEKVTLADALSNVDVLDELPLPDQQPCIECQTCSIVYRCDFDTNFEDRHAYVTGVAKYIEEATVQSNLNEMLEEGHGHAVMLYTWRCCSRCIPQPKSNEQPNRKEIYEKTVEVLGPEVKKLLNLMYFQRKAIERFCVEVRKLSHEEKRKDFVSEAYLSTLGKLINMFAVLDELKNMKSSVKNDYATYRRAAQFLKVMSDSQTLQESQNLSMFLATQGKIRDTLKENLERIKNYDDLFCDIINNAVLAFESKAYLTPTEKHNLVKIMSFSLFLIDSDQININKLDQKKRLRIDKLDKIFHELEVVPLFGDMQIAPFMFVKRLKNFESSKWPLSVALSSSSNSSTLSPQANLLTHLQSIRDAHLFYSSELARYSNEVTTTYKETPRSDAENKMLADSALSGLQLLSKWTSTVTELYSWKLLHPTDHHQTKSCPQNAEEYERAIRYNYSSEEKYGLIEVIATIKGLQVLMARMETVFTDAIRRNVYQELQDFVQVHLREALRKAIKNKKDLIRSIISSVRECCADWIGGVEPLNDPALKGKRDNDQLVKNSFDLKVPRRSVAPSSTQLYMVRTMLESLIADKSGGKRTIRKDIDGNTLMKIDEFHKTSFNWIYLLNFSKYLEECCDLSQLWYREFYLEMTMGSRIQFPIDMSMPWILTDFILSTRNSAYMEYVLYPLDLYNDAAHYALNVFRKTYLYDELEAEVQLAFDQLVFKLSDQIYTYYKHLAGSIILDKRFRQECQTLSATYIAPPPPARYITLLRQRHVQLLGRSIDLNRLICQRVNGYMLKSIDVAISRFEAGPLTGIIELGGVLRVNKLCHSLLSEHIALDDYKCMYEEANHSVSAPHGRVTLHIFWELNYDFIPNYCFNGSTNRFVRCKEVEFCTPERRKPPPITEHVWGSKALNIANQAIFSQFTGFIGVEHFKAMVEFLGYQGLTVVYDELIKIVGGLIEENIAPTIKSIVESSMPKMCKLPKHDYGSSGILSYYMATLTNSISHVQEFCEDSRVGNNALFQQFRELGNIVLFCLMIEQALSQHEVMDLLSAAPFINNLPKPFCKDNEKLELKEKRIEMKYSCLQVVPNLDKLKDCKLSCVTREADLLTRERLCCGLTMFKVILSKIKNVLINSDVWNGQMMFERPPNGVMFIDECVEFHRVWSTIQFVFSIPPSTPSSSGGGTLRPNSSSSISSPSFTVEQLFGEGLQWGGCLLITLLGQQRRFECLDFCYHLMRVQKVDGMNEMIKGVNLKRMVDRIRRFQVLNSQIFATINKYQQQTGGGVEEGEEGLSSSVNTSSGSIEHVTCFQPPLFHEPNITNNR